MIAPSNPQQTTVEISPRESPSFDCAPYIGPETTDRISNLLAEYSKKLKAASIELEKHQQQFWILILIYVVIYNIPDLIDSYTRLDIVKMRIIFYFIYGSSVLLSGISRGRKQWILRKNLQMNASHLEKAIKTASQIDEHMERDIGRRLELDLRLAEAETQLRYVDLQTGRKNSKT